MGGLRQLSQGIPAAPDMCVQRIGSSASPSYSPLTRIPSGVTRRRWRRQAAGMGAAVLLAWAVVGGCVHSSSASVMRVGENRELVLRETETGLFVGPCAVPVHDEPKYWIKGPCAVAGRSESKYWIRLTGEGPLYSPAQLAFLDENGNELPGDGDLEGELRVDQTQRRVLVNLRLRGEAMMVNGSYRLKTGD
jgi:hypothetical protein